MRSEREALVAFFEQSGLRFARIGLEAGSLSQWLHARLAETGLPALLIETRHVKASLQAITMQTDKNDARAVWRGWCAWAGCGRSTSRRRWSRRFGPC